MLKIFKNISFFKAVKTNLTKILHFLYTCKQNKKKLLLLIPENIGDRVCMVQKTEIPIKYSQKAYFKNLIFQMHQSF